jgi:hypothetical protein
MPPEDHKFDWADKPPVHVYLGDKEIGVTTGDTAMTISLEHSFQGKRRRMKERAAKLLWRHMRDLKGTLVLKESVL